MQDPVDEPWQLPHTGVPMAQQSVTWNAPLFSSLSGETRQRSILLIARIDIDFSLLLHRILTQIERGDSR